MAESFTVAMRNYFGYRPEGSRDKGEDGKELSGLADFAKELKGLTIEDKKEFATFLHCDAPSA